LTNKTEKVDALIGTSLGDYTIQTLIGRGGMARVYAGLDPKLGRRAAIKVIELQHDQEQEVTARFIREARAAANLDHPNIVSVYQFGETDDLYYMAMKLIEGRTLLNLLKSLRKLKKYLEPEMIVSIISQIASALDYAHSKGVIHRDIKPSNIMLTDNDKRAILTDFGLTMQMGTESTLGTAFGTPRYISPEQAIASHKAVPQSDIYSLGVVLFEMATGQAPFDSDSPMTLALSHITNQPPLPQSVRSDLPHPVQTVILKALEKRPENRWQTATAMAEALRDAYKGKEPNVTITQEMLEVTPQDSTTPAGVDQTALMPEVALPGRPRAQAKAGQPNRLRTRLVLLILIAGLVGIGVTVLKRREIAAIAPEGPFATPTAESYQVRLIYTKDSFYLYNASKETISLKDVVFIRSDFFKTQDQRGFPASKFGNLTSSGVGAGKCLQIAKKPIDPNNNPDVCHDPVGKWPYEDINFPYLLWALRNTTDTPDTFLVTKGTKVLQTCSMRLNTCEFSIP
jgi:serine/threonine-protein kinase